MGGPAICLCGDLGADELRGDSTTDQCLCSRYPESIIPLLKSDILSPEPI